jgi:hypothetical protein
VQGNTAAYPAGPFTDALRITSGTTTVHADGAETSPNGWTLAGFASVGATVTNQDDIRGQATQPLFRDDRGYWDASQPAASVKVPDIGTNIRVLSQDGTSLTVRVWKG